MSIDIYKLCEPSDKNEGQIKASTNLPLRTAIRNTIKKSGLSQTQISKNTGKLENFNGRKV